MVNGLSLRLGLWRGLRLRVMVWAKAWGYDLGFGLALDLGLGLGLWSGLSLRVMVWA